MSLYQSVKKLNTHIYENFSTYNELKYTYVYWHRVLHQIQTPTERVLHPKEELSYSVRNDDTLWATSPWWVDPPI